MLRKPVTSRLAFVGLLVLVAAAGHSPLALWVALAVIGLIANLVVSAPCSR
ncbi:hypothetical protein [Methylobacterium dankookense]|uniref:Uncharacterized protein n=1 Tax=Methylobacterium dankookense TaxID=560405 RepID=A0A564G5B9_9HYPH|nr:hypothetical protein [Methylobacterium dankookense]GJD55225.1 hypothetical protein IFDJLNFL_1109 [Methylobacterium dankookense]VUF15196.1 hypothetical protein MTDSW087_04931 [Methylobacterium dankookense]